MSDIKDSGTADHRPTYRRKALGRAMISGRATYGCTVKCSCGWEYNGNERKAYAESLFADHVRATDIRFRLLEAGKHLTATRFGWAINWALNIRGIDWGGTSKGTIIEEVRKVRAGESIYGTPKDIEDISLDELVERVTTFSKDRGRPAPWRARP